MTETADPDLKTPITYRGLVYPWHCDHMGHMNVMWYVGKFDEATWNLLTSLGITRQYLTQAKAGMAAVQQNITYRRELFAGDTLYIRSRLIEVREKVVRFMHEMVDAATDEIIATTEITGVHIDRELHKSLALPEDIFTRARAMVG